MKFYALLEIVDGKRPTKKDIQSAAATVAERLEIELLKHYALVEDGAPIVTVVMEPQ